MSIALVLGILLGLSPLLACAAEVTVSSGSVTDAARALNSGDTLLVEDGTYTAQLDAGSIPSGVTVKARNARRAILRPNGGTTFFNFRGGQSHITIEGFVLDGSEANGGYFIVFRSDQGANEGITIQNNEFKNMRGVNNASNSGGIFFQDPVQHVIVRNNTIHDIGNNDGPGQCSSCYSYGMYLAATGAVIEGNELYKISGYGIHAYNSGSGRSSRNIIKGNYFHDIGGPGVLLACGGDHNELVQNVIVRTGLGPSSDRGGILVGGYCSGNPSSENLVANNTLWKNNGPCIQLGHGSSGGSDNNTVRNNICYDNGTDQIIVARGSGNTIDHNLTGQDPRFANASAGDFRLQSDSPVIDVGVPVGSTFSGSAPDLGACEMGTDPCPAMSGSSPLTPTLPAPQNLRLLP